MLYSAHGARIAVAISIASSNLGIAMAFEAGMAWLLGNAGRSRERRGHARKSSGGS
jgi:hypothetical protein